MPDRPHPSVTPFRSDAAAEAAMQAIRGTRAAGGASVGRGAPGRRRLAPCAASPRP